MPPRERMLALSSFQGDFLLMTAIALNNDYILGRIKLDSFDIVVFDEAHRVVAQVRSLGSTGIRFTTSSSLSTSQLQRKLWF
jgi:Rad3-related DNA helicase